MKSWVGWMVQEPRPRNIWYIHSGTMPLPAHTQLPICLHWINLEITYLPTLDQLGNYIFAYIGLIGKLPICPQ